MATTAGVRTVKVLKMWHFKDLNITMKVRKDKEEPNTNNSPISQNFIIVKRCSSDEVKHPEENTSFNVKEIEEVKMDLCRICLLQGTIPIHGDKPSEDMANAISTFGGIAISIFDSCPKFLCESCYGLLQGAILFRKTAQCSDRLLKKYSAPDIATDDINNEVRDVNMSAQTDLETFLDKPMEANPETGNHFSSSPMDIGAEVSILEPQVCLKTSQDFSNVFKKPNLPASTTNASISKSPADVDEAPILFDNKLNLTCQQCNIQFANFNEYRDHKLHTRSHKKKMCTVCKQTYAVRYIKKYNLTLQKTVQMYVCNTCYGNNKDKACNEPEKNHFFDDLTVEHVNKALVKQNVPLTCKECNIKFDKLQDYRKHRLQTRKHTQKMCTVCNKTYAARYITKNNSTKGAYVCNDCYKKDTNNLDEEPLNDNSNKTPSSFVVRQLKLKCRQCNLLFNAHHEYTLHKNLHELKTKKCPICNKSYSKRYHKIHMQIHKAGGPDYMCDICGKHFVQYSSFKCHRETHFNNLPYACSLCPYRTLTNNSLIIHMRSHTGERPYLCEECPQKFVTKSNLIKHRYTHKKERDFKCECGKEYHTKRDLDMHVKVEHAGIKEHVCQICGKAYGYRKVLMRHQLRVHKRGKLRGGKQPTYLKIQSMKNQENDIATS